MAYGVGGTREKLSMISTVTQQGKTSLYMAIQARFLTETPTHISTVPRTHAFFLMRMSRRLDLAINGPTLTS